MRALTIWQPWASLIAIGAKPYEFRGWDYSARPGLASLVDTRIAIHAGARPVRPTEVRAILDRISEGTSALREDLALPLLERILAAHSATQRAVVPLSAVIATAVLRRPIPVGVLFADVADSDRFDHSKFAWPLDDVVRLDVPIPSRGAQGFWTCSDSGLRT